MTFKLPALFRTLFLLLSFSFAFSGCKVGDDDPAISFRSRDARLKANWKMSRLNNLVEINSLNPSGVPVRTEVQSNYDGYNMRIRTSVNGVLVSDSTFGYNFLMMLQDDGKLTYENSVIILVVGTKSTGSDNWYWISSDQKKSRVFLGSALQFANTIGLNSTQTSATLPFSTLLTDFNIDELRNNELKLSYTKSTGQTTLGGFQQITINSKMTFTSK